MKHRRRGAGARRVALDVLVAAESGGRADRALDRALAAFSGDPRDRRLITAMVYGALRRQRTLDRTVAPYCRRPLGKLDVAIRTALRLGAFQCAFLRSTPPHAAVDGTVESLKSISRGGAGLVNAVLRSWLRAGGDVDPGGDGFADRFELPDWLAERWAGRGDGAAAWLAATLRPAPVVVRPHARRISVAAALRALREAGHEAERSAWVSGAIRLGDGAGLDSDLLRRGLARPRGEASQLVVELLPPGGGGPVLDACSGRGGKAIQLAERGASGLVVAVDRNRRSLRAGTVAALEAATEEVVPVVADMRASPPFSTTFDRVLVDAPCSGLGTIRRNPEIKWRMTPQRVAQLGRAQEQILVASASVLAPGGYLLYVTCSTEPEENERVIERALASTTGLRRTEPGERFTEHVDDDGYFRTFPGCPDLEGFFAALLRRDPAT